jgi:hypothetical protein
VISGLSPSKFEYGTKDLCHCLGRRTASQRQRPSRSISFLTLLSIKCYLGEVEVLMFRSKVSFLSFVVFLSIRLILY